MQHETFDGWTFVHATSGIILGNLKVSRVTAYTLIVGTEVLEFVLRRAFPKTVLFQETNQNIVVDLLVGIAAYEVFR